MGEGGQGGGRHRELAYELPYSPGMNDPKSTNLKRAVAAAAPATVSERVRARLEAAGHRFHANDNIADFIHDAAELAALEDEVTGRMQALLESLVIDTESDHNTQGTARRVARMFLHETFKGRYHAMPPITETVSTPRFSQRRPAEWISARSA